MKAVDASMLCFAINRFAPEHARASALLEELANDEHPWALPWPAAHEFLARVTHPHSVARALRADDAWGFLAELGTSASLRWLGTTDRHAEAVADVLMLARSDEAALPTGFELAVVLREHGVRELLTSDRAMRRYRFLDVRDPVHGPGWSSGERPRRRYRTLAASATTPTRGRQP